MILQINQCETDGLNGIIKGKSRYELSRQVDKCIQSQMYLMIIIIDYFIKSRDENNYDLCKCSL